MHTLKVRQVTTVVLALVVTFSLVFSPGTALSARAAETRNIVVLATSDIHGNVDNFDYFSGTVPSTGRGLTKIATYVKNALGLNPNTIVVDNGDTIQGTPLAYKYEVLDTSKENPLALAMNQIGYVSATVGNHEFNYGPAVFNKYQAEAHFPLLSANVTGCQDYTFQPYVIKDVAGVQVGILGLTPPAVPHWERPENITGCVFGDAIAAAAKYVPEMRAAGADVIVVTAHAGLDEAYGYGLEEEFVPALANAVPGIDVIVAGHAHLQVDSQLINGVLVTEPYYQAARISNIQISVTGSGSDWTVSTKSSKVDVVKDLAEDTTLAGMLKPYHDGAVAYINTPIGTANGDFPGGFAARIADGPTADLINQVQMDAAAAAGFPVQASLAALFNDNAKLSSGPIKLKDAYALYIYDNTLYVIDATGQQIKDELEWTAGYFNQYFYEPTGVTKVASGFPDYNYDLWSGIDYKIDVTKPVGQRVVELKLNGQPLAMDQVVRLALNNYRATGKFATAPKLYQSTTEVRQLITDWIIAHGTIKPSDVFVQNYTLLPPVNTWLSTQTANPVSRSDYANLLWTAFDGNTDNYMKLPGEKKAGATLNREGGLYLLGNRAMEGLWDISPNMAVLKPYTDQGTLSSWAKVSTVYALQAFIFTPGGNKLLPKQTLTNAEALAWVREAMYPFYTFLSTNDFHGQLETGKTVSSRPVGSAAIDMTYISDYTALNPHGTLLMDGGDMMQGMPISNLLNGSSVIDVYNHMGYDAAVVGNHEFDWNQTVLQERMAQAQFPILAGNVFLAGTDTRPNWAVPTAMFTVKGQQIGVIGVTSKDTPTIVMAANVAGLDFRPVGPIVTQYVSELRAAGADIVVVLAHMPDVYGGVVSGEMLDVAQPGVDLIISGHSHSGWSGKVNGIPLIQAYSSGTAIGVSNLSYNRRTHTVVNTTMQVVTTYADVKTPNAAIAEIVAEYAAEIAPITTKKLATTSAQIVKAPNGAGESPLGNMIADAQRWKSGTQIAFMNPGGIRKDLPDGKTDPALYPLDLTWGDFFAVQPFDNKMVTMTMTGSDIYTLLEQQFPPTQASSKVLLVSGIKYSYNLALPAGSRITTLTLTDGTPILPDATTYTVAMNNYLATGGDSFKAFLKGTNVTYIGVSDLEALIDYVEFKYGPYGTNTTINPALYPVIEGRITKQ